MKTILITGALGFLGRNLITHLQLDPTLRLLSYDVDNSEAELEAFLAQADFVFHLAGVNRPQREEEFQTGNADLTSKIAELLRQAGKQTPLLISSSIQAEQDNAYGRSKKLAEDAVFAYGAATGAAVYVYRLPNLFGKWSRPNYNSVVSTFCHNISHNMPIQVNNPAYVLPLAYVDDVVAAFRSALDGSAQRSADGYCFVPRTFQITLEALSQLIYSFRSSRDTGLLPDMSDPLTKFLYTTYLSYLDANDFSYFAEMKVDNRGWLFELIKSPQIGQLFVSQTKPGITRGGHYHHTKVEKFVVVQGKAVIRFRKIDSADVIEYPVSDAKIEIVDIPPGYTHDITNVGEGDVITLFWASEIFDPDHADTYYLKV